MARLCEGEYEERQKQIFRLLQLYRWGVKESEIAQELGLDRRTVNNYLRELEAHERAEKSGWMWFSK
jgi:DNA-binding transcriptional regulator LsrR (DeoR family)